MVSGRAIVIPLNPVPKPRQTRRDKWQRRPSVVQYRDFADGLRDHLAKEGLPALQGSRATVLEGARITFCVAMPQSWSRRKRAEYLGRPHMQAPDLDNFLKAFLDAILPDDSGVWRVSAEKLWAEKGHIVLAPLE